MPSIALIGPDGAGKTTISRMLQDSGLLPIRCLYMGVNVTSSNHALLSSRVVRYLKARKPEPAPVGGPVAPRGRRSRVRAVARLANWLAEECYRQALSWVLQARGYTVLYDRHFVFDFAPEIAATADEPIDQRLHRWFLTFVYPRPDLVVYLDAPGEVLYARKGELTPEELERRRRAFLAQGERTSNFVVVDAAQPLPQVYDEVVRHVLRLSGPRWDGRSRLRTSLPQ